MAKTIPASVDGDMEECAGDGKRMAANIPGSWLLLQPQVSHFSFLQDPEQFSSDVLHFLAHVQGK
jgi:hypothetical protein